jgi:Cholesterol oxidase, substrate-binding
MSSGVNRCTHRYMLTWSKGWTYTTDGAWADQILLTETVPDLYRNGPAQAGTGR